MALEVYSRTKDGAAKLSANFTVNEFACKDGSDPVFVDSDLIRILQAIRDRLQVPVSVTSGYRTYSYQSSLFNQYIANERAAHPDWTYEQAVTQVLTYSARPGTSEHQTGLCMDLIVGGANPVLDESFADHACYRWLVENAHKFGFILRFPKGKETVTGYSYEPWHYRFVGVEAATEIYRRGITLEQYLEKY